MDLIEETISAVESTSEDWRAKARSRIAQLTMPPRALGRLLELAEQVVASPGKTLTAGPHSLHSTAGSGGSVEVAGDGWEETF